jgi:hypothetical protein
MRMMLVEVLLDDPQVAAVRPEEEIGDRADPRDQAEQHVEADVSGHSGHVPFRHAEVARFPGDIAAKRRCRDRADAWNDIEDAEPLLAQARATPDSRQRAALLIEASRLMDQAQLFIPIAAPIRWSLVSGRVPGFSENIFARHTLVGLTESSIGADTR